MTGLDLAVIGNCTVAFVIVPVGPHVWFCFPRLDADPEFNALLGGAAAETGFLEARLRDQTGAEQRYLPNTAVLDGTMIDACTLLLPGLGLLPAADPQFLVTPAVTELHLLCNGFVMRYVEEDNFGKPGSAFLVCTFWYIDALASVGRRQGALTLFTNVLAHRTHLGLLSEDIAPNTGALWGNFPQTYFRAGLIFAAMRLSRSWEEGLWRAS